MNVLSEIYHILASVHSKQPLVPGSLVYNEGWLLRLVLTAEKEGIPCLPFRFAPGARWFAETLLHTPFAASSRKDPWAETCTHADAVVGHFDFDPGSKLALKLDRQAMQFIVCEAKMYSPLGSRTTRAPGFDQAARTVACMAHALALAGRPPQEYQSLGFYVLAPEKQIRAGRFQEKLTPASVGAKIHQRVQNYDGNRLTELRDWQESWVRPLLEGPTFQLGCVSWEAIIDQVYGQNAEYGQDLREFYAFCNRFNRSQSARPYVWASPEGDKDVILVRAGAKNCRVRLEGGRDTLVPKATLRPK